MRFIQKYLRIFIILALILTALPAQALDIQPDSTADMVYGQGGDFTTNTINKGGVSADSLYGPTGVVVDNNRNLYVTDYMNSRVLYYPAGRTTATRVYGQGGDFTTNTINKNGVSADSLSLPFGVALDSNGNLYVADYENIRVLYYPAGSTTATRVYGQGGDFTTVISNRGGISADSLGCAIGLALDNSGNLYVADNCNNRVLYYPAGSTTATRVYGQGGDFTTNTANKGGVSADSLSFPGGVVLDGSGNLYVADSENHRILYYPAGSTTATRVYGQGGDFTTNATNKDGVSADSLYSPFGMALDGNGNLYVVDYGNNRVLYYPAGSTTATFVYGQGGDFTTNTSNKGGVSADSLSHLYGIALDGNGNLYVADSGNIRVLRFSNPTFVDVPDSYWAWSFIERLYNAGITGGCSTSPLNYCPESEVTRAQMAVFLERGLHYPSTFTAPNVAPTFTDTVGHWAEDWIEALKNDGITSGCATELYCPEAPVTRAQMAVFLLRAKYGSSYTPPVVGAGTGFADVPTDHWAAGWIKQLVAEGITSGCGGGNYCPEAPVTRAQMAVFLVRTFGLP